MSAPNNPPTSPDGLLKLAERCEQAAGPDRELDCIIDTGIGHQTHNPHGPSERANWPQRESGLTVPRYTASLDAAMTLVPEGWAVIVGAYPDARKPFARLFPPDYANSPLEHEESNDCASHALALCAAALKARASQ